MRFFDILRSTSAEVDVLRTDLTMWAGTIASATTDLPRPSTQFTAAGFLSVQKLPKIFDQLLNRFTDKLIN